MLSRQSVTAPGQPMPFEKLCAQVALAQTRHVFFPVPAAGQRVVVVVGVSGGADSVCLLHTLQHFAQAWQLELHVGHLDHGLRPTAAADAAFVATLAQQWSLPYHGAQLAPGTLAAQGGSLEAAARAARYAFLAGVAQRVTPARQEPIIALAHHADDQAETVLLHLVRGSGLQGISGMRPVVRRQLQELQAPANQSVADQSVAAQSITVAEKQAQYFRLVRPFLHIRRTEILQSLRSSGLAWREDESNEDDRFARNFLRHQVMPKLAQLNPQVVAAIGRLAELTAADSDRLAALDQTQLAAVQLTPLATPLERIVLDLAQLRALPPVTQLGVLRQALLHFPALADLGLQPVERLVAMLQQPIVTGGPYPLLGEVAWSVAGATVDQPARLSLHHQAALPFAPDHPYLGTAWPPTPVGAAGEWAGEWVVAGEWRLVGRHLPLPTLPADWQSSRRPWQAYLDAAQVGVLSVTTPQPGQRFAPLGLQGQHKQLGDFFTDRKIHPSLRRGWPLLVDQASGAIRWVCGLTIDHHARITTATQTVLYLSWERRDES